MGKNAPLFRVSEFSGDHLGNGESSMRAKPFVKWVGGKRQLLEQLACLLPKGLSMRGFVNREFSPRAKNLFLNALSPRFYPHSIPARCRGAC